MTKNQKALRLVKQLPPGFTPIPAEWFHMLNGKNRRRMQRAGKA